MDPLTASLIATGIGMGAEALTSKDPKISKTSTFSKTQKTIQFKLMADILGIPSSQLRNADDFKKLIKSGYLDEMSLYPGQRVYRDERVAPLTGTQQEVLGGLEGFVPRISDTSVGGAAGGPGGVASIFERRGLTPPTSVTQNPLAEVVGENGPETITANQDVQIIPNAQAQQEVASATQPVTAQETFVPPSAADWLQRAPAWWQHPLADKATKLAGKFEETGKRPSDKNIALLASLGLLPQTQSGAVQSEAGFVGPIQSVNPLVTEDNQVGANENEFSPRLPRRRLGGGVDTGQKVLVGEQGPELVVQTQQAASRALSGDPSSKINRATTEQFIQQGIADPARRGFERGTLQQIKSSYAGPGFWGSARAKAETTGRSDVEAQINALGSQYRYQDEQSRRNLAESAANRSLAAIPSALNVQNNPLGQQQQAANIEATRFGTERGGALLGGEVGQQQANISATQFGTERGQTLLGGEVGQQRANIQQTLSTAGLTDEQTNRVSGLIEQDLATTGQISANTKQTLANIGMTDAAIQQIESNTALSDIDLFRRAGDLQIQQQNVVRGQLENFARVMVLAGIEQAQNQAEINADMAEYASESQALMAVFDWFNSILGQTQTAAIVEPGQQGIGGAVAEGVGDILASPR